jgi:hypothetical protein
MEFHDDCIENNNDACSLCKRRLVRLLRVQEEEVEDAEASVAVAAD